MKLLPALHYRGITKSPECPLKHRPACAEEYGKSYNNCIWHVEGEEREGFVQCGYFEAMEVR